MDFTSEEVNLYLEGVGVKETADASGILRIPCRISPHASAPHDPVMDGRTGFWTDQGPHGRRDLTDF